MKKCKHEYRVFNKGLHDTSPNEVFYCIYCLEIVIMYFHNYDKVIKDADIHEKD